MRTGILLSIFVLIIGFSACKKNNDAPAVKIISNLNVINASTDTINSYLDGSRLNGNSNLYPLGSSGYYPVSAGEQTFQIKKPFNSISNSIQSLFSFPIMLKADNTDTSYYYSLFVAGETSSQAFYTIDLLQNDTLNNTCLVRFVNASPTSGSLDLAVGDTAQFTNIAFKSASGFKLVSVNATTDSLKPIKIFQTGSATPIISNKVNLAAGYSYTFYAKGSLTGNGNSAFGLGTTINVTQ